MNRRHPGLADKMLKVEGEPTPLKPDILDAADIIPDVSEDLMDYLTANCDGEAAQIIQGAQAEHGLEAWRRISYASEPRGTFSELRDTRLATRPPRCPKASELPAHFASFEEKLLKLTNRTGTCPSPQKANVGQCSTWCLHRWKRSWNPKSTFSTPMMI